MRVGCVRRRTDKQLCCRLKLRVTSIECPPSADFGGTRREIAQRVESQILAGARSSAGWALSALDPAGLAEARVPLVETTATGTTTQLCVEQPI